MKKDKFCFIILFALAFNAFGAGSKDERQLSDISNEISRAIRRTQINTGDSLVIVAINNTNVETASSIINSVETALVQSNYVKLISRRYITEALNEIELGHSGYIDDDSAARIGHFLGSKYIMLGEIISSRLTIQILEVETLLIAYSEQFDISFLNKVEEPRRFRF